MCGSCGEAWIDEYVTPPPPEPAHLHDVDDVLDDLADELVDGSSDSAESPVADPGWKDTSVGKDSVPGAAAALPIDGDDIQDTWDEDTDHDDSDNDWDEPVDQDDDTDDDNNNDVQDTWDEDADHDDSENDWDEPVDQDDDSDDDDVQDTWSEDADHDDSENDWDEPVDQDDDVEDDSDDDVRDTWDEDADHEDADHDDSENDWDEPVDQDDDVEDDWDDDGPTTVTSSSVATEVTMTPIHTPYETKERRSRIPLGLVAVAVLGVIAWLSWFRPNATFPPPTTVVAQSTVVPPETTTTAAPPTSSTPPSTTTLAPPTTTIAPVTAIGSPIALSELTMGGFAFGPFSFGSNGEQVLGRLTATFGQPDSLGPADTTWGLCATDSGSVATWGGIAAIFRDVDGTSEFVGYRIGDATGIDDGDPGGDLATLSGISIGDTITTLRQIYANSTIELFELDGQPYFRLLRSGTQRLLLYGPISVQADDGSILGIYSRDACSA